MSEISFLLAKLEDPFELFPLQEISDTLNRTIDDSRNYLAERAGWYGVSPKYRTVDEEHTEEVIFNLIGSAFVLAQTSIVQAAAIAMKLREIAAKPTWMPNSKPDVLNMEPIIHEETGISQIVLFNAVANYFKHHHQWSADWTASAGGRPERETIENVRKLGLAPGATKNLETAMRSLGLKNLSELTVRLQTWRERLAENLRVRLTEHGLD